MISKQEPNNPSSILIYQTDDGSTRLKVRLENETVWLNQNQIAEGFNCQGILDSSKRDSVKR